MHWCVLLSLITVHISLNFLLEFLLARRGFAGKIEALASTSGTVTFGNAAREGSVIAMISDDCFV